MKDTRLVTRLAVKNYRSIAFCQAEFRHPLTFLVGPNSSGKSNLIDALSFVRDALRYSIESGLEERGGFRSVIHQPSTGHLAFAMRVDFQLPSEATGHYALEIVEPRGGGFAVSHEQCVVRPPGRKPVYFDRGRGRLSAGHRMVFGLKDQAPRPIGPEMRVRLADDRLYLPSVAVADPAFGEATDALIESGFYNPQPALIRPARPAGLSTSLLPDASNLGSVLQRVQRRGEAGRMINEFLNAVVPGVTSARARTVHGVQLIEFEQETLDGGRIKLPAHSMSDGTLHALAVLVALFQSWGPGGEHPPLLAVEEPEIALHPAAAGALRDAFRVAANRTQVIATSHSPDLLDDREVDVDSILSVAAPGGQTRVGPVNEATRSVLKNGLFTVGELLRLDQLTPAGEEAKQETVLFENLTL